jgi:hypothetical protein
LGMHCVSIHRVRHFLAMEKERVCIAKHMLWHDGCVWLAKAYVAARRCIHGIFGREMTNIRSYMVHIYSSGRPYGCVIRGLLPRHAEGKELAQSAQHKAEAARLFLFALEISDKTNRYHATSRFCY